MPHALAFAVAVLTLDRLGAIAIPARMYPVLHAVSVMVDGGALAVGVPHRPFARLFAVVVVALDHPGTVRVVDDECAVLDRHAADLLFAPDFRTIGRRRAFELSTVG